MVATTAKGTEMAAEAMVATTAEGTEMAGETMEAVVTVMRNRLVYV